MSLQGTVVATIQVPASGSSCPARGRRSQRHCTLRLCWRHWRCLRARRTASQPSQRYASFCAFRYCLSSAGCRSRCAATRVYTFVHTTCHFACIMQLTIPAACTCKSNAERFTWPGRQYRVTSGRERRPILMLAVHHAPVRTTWSAGDMPCIAAQGRGLLALSAGLGEEVFFRGFMQTSLAERFAEVTNMRPSTHLSNDRVHPESALVYPL